MPSAPMTRDKMSGDALFILKSLKENARLGRSNKLADVKLVLENSVSLEFDSYFFFLRKFHYIAMDRDAQLKLTDQGERVVEGEVLEKFTGEVGEFFAEQLTPEASSENRTVMLQPSPPSTSSALSTDAALESLLMAQPPSRGGGRRPLTDEVTPPPHVSSPEGKVAPAYSSAQLPPPPVPLPLTAAMVSSPSQVAKGGGIGPMEGDTRYQKGDQLGAGPLGAVFRGRHNALGVDVCLKELKDIFGYFSFLQRGEVIKRLKKELCAQAQVRHPGVVQILDQNTEVGRPFYVMELCRGSLREKLDASGGKGVPVPVAMRYFLQIAYALRAAHQQGLTHHNLKPENVLFDAWGNVKLGDFGLSRVIEVDQSKGMPQVFVGTGGMPYMSPELMSRAKDPGPACDVYALGILLYEMLAGQLPGRRSPLPSEVNPECPPKLDSIFDKMTQDRRESRYADFEAVFEDFYAAFGDKTYLGKGDLIMWSELAQS